MASFPVKPPVAAHPTAKGWRRWLPSYRFWKTLHRWLGLVLFLQIVLVGTTGALLLQRDALGLRQAPVRFAPVRWWYEHGLAGSPPASGADRRGGPLAPAAADPRAEGARGQRGQRGARGRSLQAVTLYTAGGEAVRVAAEPGALWLQTAENAAWVPLEESPWRATAETVSVAGAPSGPREGGPSGSRGELTWGRVINDLHRGRFFAGRLDWFYTLAAAGLVILSCSGFWLWLKPWLTRRVNVQAPAAAPRREAAAASATTSQCMPSPQ